jgi:hypothetical protein
LYLRGVSTGDFQEALAALLGKDAPNLSPSVVTRLTATVGRGVRPLAGARPLGAPLCLRLGRRRLPAGPDGEPSRVHAGSDRRHARGEEGTRRLPGGRSREHPELARAAGRGEAARLAIAPEIAVGDGALGFWRAIDEVFPGTRHQRCWLHKTANVLNKVPRSVQRTMKADLREIHGAPTRAAAETAMDVFAEKYGAKYARAAECLRKDRDALLAFYDLPAEHWDHLATDKPDRERVCDGAAPDGADQGRALADDRQADGVQARDGGREELAAAQG